MCTAIDTLWHDSLEAGDFEVKIDKTRVFDGFRPQSSPFSTKARRLRTSITRLKSVDSHACGPLGCVRVSTDKQAEQGVPLDAQSDKIRAMALVHEAELIDIIVDGGESAKSLQRPGMTRLLAMVDRRQVQAVIVAKFDRLTRSVKDLCELLERFERRGVALISVAESLDTGSAAGRRVLKCLASGSKSQWAFKT